ncbi:hypothetical protein SARC_16244, partial [Sphaeroforma arctica JP610]
VNTPTEDPTCLWECAALAASVKDYAAKFNYRTSDLGKQRRYAYTHASGMLCGLKDRVMCRQ